MSDIEEKRSTKNTIVCSFLILVPVESLFVKLDDNLEKDNCIYKIRFVEGVQIKPEVS